MVTNAFFYPDVGREAEVSDGRRCYQLDTYNIREQSRRLLLPPLVFCSFSPVPVRSYSHVHSFIP
jgi:hypothetical protein